MWLDGTSHLFFSSPVHTWQSVAGASTPGSVTEPGALNHRWQIYLLHHISTNSRYRTNYLLTYSAFMQHLYDDRQHTCSPMVTRYLWSGESAPIRNEFGPVWLRRYSLAFWAFAIQRCISDVLTALTLLDCVNWLQKSDGLLLNICT